jgi:hypothetical protein
MMRTASSTAFDSSGDRSPVTGYEILAPQSDSEGDDGEPGYNDCPRLGTKPLEPLCVKLDRAEDCRGSDDPTAVGACRPGPNSDDDDRPTDMNAISGNMEVVGAPSFRFDHNRLSAPCAQDFT